MVKLNFIWVGVTFSTQNYRRAFWTNCCNGIKFKLNAVGGHLSAGLPSRHQVVSSSMLPSRTPFVEENPSTRVLCLTHCFFLFRFLSHGSLFVFNAENKISCVSWHFQFATFTSLSSWRASKLNPGASENHRWDADWSGIIQYCPVGDRIGRVPFTRWQDTPRHRI